MGTLILLFVLIFEISFASYSLVTKKNHLQMKNWSRIAIFFAF